MNERIQELAKQASDAVAGNAFSMARYNEKFAELIVQECMNVLHDNELHNRHISHVLREHFGVEE